MVDIQATLFRLRLYVFEYGPLFLAAWLGVAVTTGLITAAQNMKVDIMTSSSSSFWFKHLRWLWQPLFFLLWQPGKKVPALSTFSGLLIFSLAASVPALVVTSLIDMNTVWMRLLLAALYALSLNWFITSIISLRQGNHRKERMAVELALQSRVLSDDSSLLQPRGLYRLVQVVWKSFSNQVGGALIPLIIGLSLASALTIYIPAHTIRPWLGEGGWQGPYVAAVLATPFQLVGGAEVLLASALLVKGASQGTALSVLLVAPTTSFLVVRPLWKSVSLKVVAMYFTAAWLVAGSLGAAVDGIQ
jgi:hypothetical protein